MCEIDGKKVKLIRVDYYYNHLVFSTISGKFDFRGPTNRQPGAIVRHYPPESELLPAGIYQDLKL